MGFDPNSLASVQLNELLEDHAASLDNYLAFKVCRKRPVSNADGAVYRFETPLEMAADQQRSVKHAPGSPSPEGNTKLGVRGYHIDSYSWKEGINHLAGQELATVGNALEVISGSTAHTVMAALDRELASILSGNGDAATFDDLTQKVVSNDWVDGASNDPVDDIDSVVSALRPGSRGLVCVCGYDVALALSKNAAVVNNADADHTNFDGVRDFLRSRGITEIYIDINPQQDGEREATRSYTGIFDGVFYIGTADNLIMPIMNELTLDTFINPDPRMTYFRAALDADITTGYANHGRYFTGTLS